MTDLLVDTDVLVDHLRGTRALRRDPGSTLHCSVITRAELVAGAADEQDAVRGLLDALREIPVDREIATAAGRIRREVGIALPDALIAATALARSLSLLTRNRRDFERVGGLLLA